jgi:hypothetical protein
MFCAHGPNLGGTMGAESSFLVLRFRTQFRRYRRRRVPFSCFALSDSFSTMSRSSGSIFMFCAPELAFGGTEGVGSYFNVLRCRTHFGRHRGRQVKFSCFALQNLFWAVPRASSPVFMFCSPGLVFESAVSNFHVLRSRTHFRRYQGRRVSISYFVLLDSF